MPAPIGPLQKVNYPKIMEGLGPSLVITYMIDPRKIVRMGKSI